MEQKIREIKQGYCNVSKEYVEALIIPVDLQNLFEKANTMMHKLYFTTSSNERLTENGNCAFDIWSGKTRDEQELEEKLSLVSIKTVTKHYLCILLSRVLRSKNKNNK